jgi:hypothetical protein
VVAEQVARQAELEQQLRQVKQERAQTLAQLEVELQSVQQQQDELTESLTQLKARLGILQTSCRAALEESYAMPVSRMSIDQAHALCATVTGMDLPYIVFKEHGIDGAALITMEQLDVKDLFGIEHIGLCHRLVHCARKAAHTPAPQLVATDFAAEEQQLQAWLAEQDGVSEDNQRLVAQARFDMATCGYVTAPILGMAGVPFAARKPLLMLLQHAHPTVSSASDAAIVWQPEVQRAVLEQVLQENKALAERLSQQQREHTGGRQATVPDEYLCPITCEVMEDPVIAEDGQTYEREAIATWVAGHGTSPMTRQRMANMLFPNRAIKGQIERWTQGSV